MMSRGATGFRMAQAEKFIGRSSIRFCVGFGNRVDPVAGAHIGPGLCHHLVAGGKAAHDFHDVAILNAGADIDDLDYAVIDRVSRWRHCGRC